MDKRETCIKCGRNFAGHAMGICKECRMVKCGYPGCETQVIRMNGARQAPRCQRHNGKLLSKTKYYVDENMENA